MRNKKENFIKGVIYLMTSQVIIKVLGMIYSLYLTNKKGFGDEGNAICMSAYQIYALFLGICSIGIPNAISRIIAENVSLGQIHNCKKILKVSLLIFTSIAFLFCLVLYLGSNIIAEKILSIKESSDILKILAPSIVFCTIEAVFRGYFNGREQIKISAKVQTIEQLLKTIVTIMLVEYVSKFSNYNTELMAKASMVAASIATVFSFIYSFKKFAFLERNHYLIDKNKTDVVKSIREILSEIFIIAIPISITSVLMILESNIDSISIVRLLKDKIGEKNAREKYGIITSKVNLLVALPMSLNGAIAVALVPEISRAKILSNFEMLKEKVELAFLLTLLISIPVMVGYVCYSKEIIELLYPNAKAGAELLKFGSLTIVFTSLAQTISGILQGIGDSKTHLKAIGIAMIFKLLLNFILIPLKGLYEKGAILSTIICDCIIFLILSRKLHSYIKVRKCLIENFLKISFIMIVIQFLTNYLFGFTLIETKLEFILKIILLIVLYIISIFLFKILKIKIVIDQLGWDKTRKD